MNTRTPLAAPGLRFAKPPASLGISILLAVGLGGCSASSTPLPLRAAAEPSVVLSAAEKAEVLEAREQRSAQRAWCDYLDALYVRTAEAAAAEAVTMTGLPNGAAMVPGRQAHWPRFEQCLEVTTTAAPRMLRHTAECSHAALRRFEGDPFTPAYAHEVSRCGAEAIEGMEVTAAEVAPFLSTLCSKMASCGEASTVECNAGVRAHLAPPLERAIGAMNRRGRAQLKACLKGAACQEVGAQLATCLEPLMEDLLWLPD